MLPRVNVIDTEHGRFLLFATDDVISRALYRAGTWEPWNLTISQILLEGVPLPVVVDVGANLGSYTVPIARLIAPRGGRVYAFEPQRIVFQQLCGNVFLNRLDNCHVYNVAIGEHDGEVRVPVPDYVSEPNIGGLSLDPAIRARQTGSAVDGEPGEKRLMRRLDGVDLPPVSLLKIDAEGLEAEVIAGAGKLLARSGWPPLLYECWSEQAAPWFADGRARLQQALTTLGYQPRLIGETGLAQHPDCARQFEFIELGDRQWRLERRR